LLAKIVTGIVLIRERLINSSMVVTSIIVIAGLADNKTMNKNKWRKKEDENSKV